MKLKQAVQTGIIVLGLAVMCLGAVLAGMGLTRYALHAVVGGLIAWCAWIGFSAVSVPSARELPKMLASFSGKKSAKPEIT